MLGLPWLPLRRLGKAIWSGSLWLSGLRKIDEWTTQEQDVWRGCEASNCWKVLEAGEWATGENNCGGWDWAQDVDSFSTNLRRAVYQRRQVLNGRNYVGSWKLEKTSENNVQLLQGSAPSSSKMFSSFRMSLVQPLRIVSLWEELLMHYVNKEKIHGRRKT